MQVEIDDKTWNALLTVVLTGEPPAPDHDHDAPENRRYYDASWVLGEFIAKHRPFTVRGRPKLFVVPTEMHDDDA